MVCRCLSRCKTATTDEPKAKKAKTTEESHFEIIDGVKYNRDLLNLVDKFAADGQVGYPEAKKLWQDVQDGTGVTETEKATLEFAMKSYKFSEKATKFIKTYMEAGTHKSYYKVVAGVKYDRQLLEAAEKAAADGQVSYAEARELFEDAADGKGITCTEKDTLEYAMKTLKFTEKARKWLSRQLKLSEPTSDYNVIDGQKYDASLLSEIENMANNGEISEAETKRLWEESDDGKGVSDSGASFGDRSACY